MTSRDADMTARFSRFVRDLPVPEVPLPPARSEPRQQRSPGRAWAGVVAAAVLVIGLVLAGLVRLEAPPVPAGRQESPVMPGRQLPWLGDITWRPTGRVLITARVNSTDEDALLPWAQTLARNVSGDRTRTVSTTGATLVSSDGRWLGVGDARSAMLTLIATDSGDATQIPLPSRSPQVRPLGWSRDGGRLFVAGTRPSPSSGLEYDAVFAVDVATRAVHRIDGIDGVTALSTSPDDRLLFVAAGSRSRILDLQDGTVVRHLPAAKDVVFDLDAWSDDGRWIVGATRDRDRLVRLDARTGRRTDLPVLEGRLHGATWAGSEYLALLDTGFGESTRSTLVAVDVIDGESTEVAQWEPGWMHEAAWDVSIARHLASAFVP